MEWIVCDVPDFRVSRADRRVIREGIESWIAYSVTRREPSDA